MTHAFEQVSDHPVVVVTGASSGMGEDAALFLNQLGYTVAAGIRRSDDGDGLHAKAEHPERFHPLLLDVTDDAQVDAARAAVEVMVDDGSPFAGVFSNAGIAHFEGDTSAEGTPMSVLQTMLDVNFFGSVRFITAFLPLARATNACVVVNSALMAVQRGLRGVEVCARRMGRQPTARDLTARCAGRAHRGRGDQHRAHDPSRQRRDRRRQPVPRTASVPAEGLRQHGRTRVRPAVLAPAGVGARRPRAPDEPTRSDGRTIRGRRRRR